MQWSSLRCYSWPKFDRCNGFIGKAEKRKSDPLQKHSVTLGSRKSIQFTFGDDLSEIILVITKNERYEVNSSQLFIRLVGFFPQILKYTSSHSDWKSGEVRLKISIKRGACHFSFKVECYDDGIYLNFFAISNAKAVDSLLLERSETHFITVSDLDTVEKTHHYEREGVILKKGSTIKPGTIIVCKFDVCPLSAAAITSIDGYGGYIDHQINRNTKKARSLEYRVSMTLGGRNCELDPRAEITCSLIRTGTVIASQVVRPYYTCELAQLKNSIMIVLICVVFLFMWIPILYLRKRVRILDKKLCLSKKCLQKEKAKHNLRKRGYSVLESEDLHSGESDDQFKKSGAVGKRRLLRLDDTYGLIELAD